MEAKHNEARDAALIGAFFLGYAALVWYAARRASAETATHAFNWGRISEALANLFRSREPVTPGMEFARSIRDDLIAEENHDAD